MDANQRQLLLAATEHPPPPAELLGASGCVPLPGDTRVEGVAPLILLLAPLVAKYGMGVVKILIQAIRARKAQKQSRSSAIVGESPMNWQNPLIRGVHRPQHDWPHSMGGGEAMILGREDDWEDAIDTMLGAIEDDIDDLDLDIEGFEHYDDETMLGRMGSGVSAKIARIEAKIAAAEDKLASTPFRRAGKRQRLQSKISRLKRKLEAKRGKLTKKLERKVRKGKISPEAAVGIAAAAGASVGAMALMAPAAGPGTPAPATGPAVQGYGMLQGPVGNFTGRVAPTQLVNEVRRSPSAGEEIRLPFLLNNSPIIRVTFPANPAGPLPQVSTLLLTTRLIPYAAFQATSFDSILQVLPNPEAFVTGQLSFIGVQGDKNLVYDSEPLEFAGQFGSAGDGRTLAGLRENSIIQPVNTVTATIILQQETNTNGDIEVVLKAGTVVRSIYDLAVRR